MREAETYMRAALAEAEAAFAIGEVPIGAVVVDDITGEIVARGHNMREAWMDATAHAEVIAIREACRVLKRWRLTDCSLYVTVEPCPMCAGALLMSRMDRLFYGVPDSKAGGCESLFNIVSHPRLNHRMEVTAGILEEACRSLLKRFFAGKRI